MRIFGRALIVIVALLTLCGLVPAPSAEAQGPGRTTPITIGVLAPLTGPFNSFARDIVDGARLYLDDVNGEMARRKVELVVEDYAVKPDVALTKARKLVERDRAQAMVGIVLSAAAIAIKDYVTAQKVPLIISGFAAAESLTLQPNPYFFRITYGAAMPPSPTANWVYKNLKARTAVLVGTDSVGPLELILAFGRAFEKAGGKVVQEIYAPLGTTDFGPYIARIRRDVDVVGTMIPGSDGVRFIKQFQEFGLTGKIPVVDVAVGFTDMTNLPAAGVAALGVYGVQPYIFTIDSPRNRKFVQAFRAKFGREPGAPAEFTYDAMAAIDEAMKATGGNIEDSARFVEALAKTSLDTPRGRIRFDRFHNVIADMHMSRIEKVGDRIQPVVVETIHGVDQFLGMDPAEYLKQPRLINLKGTFGK
ncbi:MAG: ABC transporter substrate-binding protein [Candidatus Tectomicrobia bacterium]|uniref:ABC transporter substrate-binding protein n=1 Tax=Tectimicrobiota bacterium TaxID=2528274 RepID=A0A932GRS2_UNCTE|nr:ABC transporter substrate-binding protein [Candidatus Tectomicrobia bacterium]